MPLYKLLTCTCTLNWTSATHSRMRLAKISNQQSWPQPLRWLRDRGFQSCSTFIRLDASQCILMIAPKSWTFKQETGAVMTLVFSTPAAVASASWGVNQWHVNTVLWTLEVLTSSGATWCNCNERHKQTKLWGPNHLNNLLEHVLSDVKILYMISCTTTIKRFGQQWPATV